MANMTMFKTQWKAVFKNGDGEAIVYGESEDEAMRNALAAYRKKKGALDYRNAGEVVKRVEFIG